MVYSCAYFGTPDDDLDTAQVRKLDYTCRKLRLRRGERLLEVSDYRDIDHDQQYDKIVSVGMFEHVGEALLPEYFQRAWNLLRPGSVFLNHGIAHSISQTRTILR